MTIYVLITIIYITGCVSFYLICQHLEKMAWLKSIPETHNKRQSNWHTALTVVVMLLSIIVMIPLGAIFTIYISFTTLLFCTTELVNDDIQTKVFVTQIVLGIPTYLPVMYLLLYDIIRACTERSISLTKRWFIAITNFFYKFISILALGIVAGALICLSYQLVS